MISSLIQFWSLNFKVGLLSVCMEGFLRGLFRFFMYEILGGSNNSTVCKNKLALKRIADFYTLQITLHKCRLSILVLKNGLISMCMAGFHSVFVLGHL